MWAPIPSFTFKLTSPLWHQNRKIGHATNISPFTFHDSSLILKIAVIIFCGLNAIRLGTFSLFLYFISHMHHLNILDQDYYTRIWSVQPPRLYMYFKVKNAIALKCLICKFIMYIFIENIAILSIIMMESKYLTGVQLTLPI
jgi:hypothetical protein